VTARGAAPLVRCAVSSVSGDALAVFRETARASPADLAVLIHCISGDLAMSAGIALSIRTVFGVEGLVPTVHVPSIQWHASSIPTVTVNASICNLVTKRFHYEKPALAHVCGAIDALARACQRRDVRVVVTPRIACGIDGHRWSGTGGVFEYLCEAISRLSPCVNRLIVVS
jgi:hypothetical protein